MKNISKSTIFFLIGSVLIFGVVQFLISTGLINTFWKTILLLAGVMAIVSLGLNLIYGFNGQFSLGQYGFYAIGAYTAADITFRWTQLHSASGLTVVLFIALFAGATIMGHSEGRGPRSVEWIPFQHSPFTWLLFWLQYSLR